MIILKVVALFFFPLLLASASMGLNVYIVCRDLNKTLDNFKGSIVVSAYGDLWRAGPWFSRFMLSYIVMGSVVFPGKHIRNGVLDSAELARLPSALRVRMAVSASLLISAFLWFFLSVVGMTILKKT